MGPILALIATITTGKTSLMPKTAMSTPMVRKIFCQKALSKDSEISRTHRIATIPNASHPP